MFPTFKETKQKYYQDYEGLEQQHQQVLRENRARRQELRKENLMAEKPIEEQLRVAYPHGHPAFLDLTLKELALHSNKNHDYSKGGPPLGNFERVATILALYPHLKLSDQRVVALVYALKQLDAVLWGISEGIEHKVEGLNARLQDISVYAKLVMCMNEDRAMKTEFVWKDGTE